MEPEEPEEEQEWSPVELTDTKTTTLLLSNRDFEFVVETLLNPPEPSEQLRAAWRRYKERMEAEHGTGNGGD